LNLFDIVPQAEDRVAGHPTSCEGADRHAGAVAFVLPAHTKIWAAMAKVTCVEKHHCKTALVALAMLHSICRSSH